MPSQLLNVASFDVALQVDPIARREQQAAAAAPAAADLGLKRVSAGVYLVTDAASGIGALRAAVQISAQAGTPVSIAVTDVEKAFTNEGAAALGVFNLPTAVANLAYLFGVQDADGIQVVASADDTIRVGAVVSAVAGNIKSTSIGSTLLLIAINATEWVAFYLTGSWVVT